MTHLHDLPISTRAAEEINKILLQYPEDKRKSALLPILHVVQNETDGWLQIETMNKVAALLQIKPIEVYEVATFYTMFRIEPVGKYVIEVCQTGPCMICGAEKLVSYLEKKLGIQVGQTTPDGQFTLTTVECLGACGYAPMFQIGETYYENLTEEKVDEILASLSKNESPKEYR
jgi:NADH-quinone oxidoreductase subunit E